MTIELKSTFIPRDLHKILKQLSVDNDTTVQAEVERALRDGLAVREQCATTQQSAQTAQRPAVTP